MGSVVRTALAGLFIAVVMFVAAPAQVTAQDAPLDETVTDEVPGGDPAGTDGGGEADDEEAPATDAADEETVAAEQPASLPTGFSSVELGMPVDTVKDRLRADSNFFYRGDPDVTLTPDREQQLIEVEGTFFVERAFFQFEDEELYIIILQLNRSRLDYFTMYTELEGKYGEPVFFEPSQVVWESEDVRMSLEKPLTVKYVSRPVFDSLVASGEMERSQRDLSREDFLEQF
ncbi:MAG: hypothetical protein GVY14_11810 [Spirochaetes bacterium]|jgi:hypothetical protein|nr:hypothetical protein [Spirochaetota bacterium]